MRQKHKSVIFPKQAAKNEVVCKKKAKTTVCNASHSQKRILFLQFSVFLYLRQIEKKLFTLDIRDMEIIVMHIKTV